MVVLDFTLFSWIEVVLTLIFVATPLLCIVGGYKPDYWVLCMIFAFIAMSLSPAIYEPYSVEYNNGYNDYPDDSVYSAAKIIDNQNQFLTSSHWYCDGWEAAQKKATGSWDIKDVEARVSRH